MERRLLHIFLALVCVVTQAMAMTGSGTAADPYLISSAADLVTFRDTYINNNAKTAACAKLTADIDLSTVCSATLGTNWHSIGVTYPYTGTFDGDGHTVSNIYIKMSGTLDATVGSGGLFHHVSGTVKNVKIKNPYIWEDISSGGPDAAGLCYTLNLGGLIDNCSVDGGTFYTGASTYSGMVCYNYGTIKNCTNNSGYSGMGKVQGGIVANNGSTGVVSSCVNNADMTFSSQFDNLYAGIVGQNDGIVEDCINNGKMYCKNTTRIAGIVNANNGTVRNCLSKGDFQSDVAFTSIGAVVHFNYSKGTVTNCYYRDDIKVYQGTTPLTGKLNGYYQNINASATPDTHALTSAQCASGEAAWRLNGSTASVTTWKQLLGTDANPSPLGTYTVYYANNTYSNSVIDASGTYLISNAVDLKLFADKVNTSTDNAGLNAKLMADIDLSSICGANVGTSGTNWTPIGNKAAGYTYNGTRYSGTFDGNGKTISGLYINSSSHNNTLFYYVGTSAKVKNLTVDANINGKYNCAAIAAYNYGTISGCTAKGTIVSTGYSGGSASYNQGTIEHCANEAKVTSSYSEKIGGITGENPGTINYSVNRGIIENTGSLGTNTGGIAGYNDGTISNSYYLADVTSKGYVGGIVGYHSFGSVTNCYNTADVTSTGSATTISTTYASTTGAIVGYAESNYNHTLTNCHYLSTITLKRSDKDTTLVGVGTGGTYEANTYAKTADELKTGIVARLLNGGNGTTESATSAWGQNLATTGGNAYPVMMTDGNANAVYCASVNDVKTYCNTGKVITIPAATTSYVDEKIRTGAYKDAGGNVVSGSRTVTADMTLSQSVDNMASHKSNADSYYEISTAVQMKWLSYYVNASSAHAATNARLMADIDLSSVCSTTAGNWTPIGNSYTISYSGTFDGNGKAISNLYIANATTEYQGLFGYARNNVIKDLSVSGKITSTNNNVGLLTGYNLYGQIIHSISSVSASGSSYVGGIAGKNGGGSITQCVNKAELSSVTQPTGGITAYCYSASITDCLNKGNVKAGKNDNKTTAGIVGYTMSGSTIKNCLNMGKVYVADNQTEDYPILGSDPQASTRPSTLTNNYYLNTQGGTAVTNATAKTADELQTGTVARLLNGGDGTTENPLGSWGQNLATTGGDAHPVMMTDGNANAVYCASVNGVKTYGNTGKVITLPVASFADEKIYTGDYKDAADKVVTSPYTIAAADVTLSQTLSDDMAQHTETIDGKTYYQISTAVQMKWLSYYVNASSAHAATNAQLINNIDLSSVCSATAGDWTPIGNDVTISYGGTFDGNGKTISNLYIANAKTDYQGLFGFAFYCVIKNLSTSGNITSTAAEVGLLAGYNHYGQIIHCISSGSASGSSYVGGIAGNNTGGSITQCVNKAELNSTSGIIGGITSFCSETSITDCLNEGTVKASDEKYPAGIVRESDYSSTIKNCLNMGKVYVKDVLTEDYPILGLDADGITTLTNNYYLNTLNGT